jgi:hypothetical protein
MAVALDRIVPIGRRQVGPALEPADAVIKVT